MGEKGFRRKGGKAAWLAPSWRRGGTPGGGVPFASEKALPTLSRAVRRSIRSAGPHSPVGGSGGGGKGTLLARASARARALAPGGRRGQGTEGTASNPCPYLLFRMYEIGKNLKLSSLEAIGYPRDRLPPRKQSPPPPWDRHGGPRLPPGRPSPAGRRRGNSGWPPPAAASPRLRSGGPAHNTQRRPTSGQQHRWRKQRNEIQK